MDYRYLCEQIFLAGIAGVMPQKLIDTHLKLSDNILLADGKSFDLNSVENIYVIGAGKAGAYMAAAVENIIGDRITGGCVVVKYGFSTALKYIKVIEAGHPVPDTGSFSSTREIIRIAAKAGENDIVICLFSGGGSSLLADTPEYCNPDDMIKLNELLVNCGADINEVNMVRKHLSGIKGGQLATIASPASLINIMISDVPGNMTDVIASGPAVPDPTTFMQAFEVLTKYKLTDKVSKGIFRYIEEGVSGLRKETPKPGDQVFKKTINILAGTNYTALESAKIRAVASGLTTEIVTDRLQGDVNEVARFLTGFAVRAKRNKNVLKPACFLFGGETTVKMAGKGRGGRNQHLAMLITEMLNDAEGITILCAGTDGNDGSTDVAGAVIDSQTFVNALTNAVDPHEHITGFDSYDFFRKAGGQVITGPTKTNVMDMVVVIISENVTTGNRI